MISCLLLDDEPLAIELLEDFIRRIPFLNLSEKFTEPLLALDYLSKNEVDLIFLDIKMPDLTGIDFFKSLNKKPELIFTTAYSEFAVQGFELQALDYLLKPISFERFLIAVNRAKEYVDAKKSKQGNNYRDYFFINVSHKIYKFFYNEILYLEGLKDYTKVYLTTSTPPVLVLYNLKYFEDFLNPNEFVRIHRSFIVPISKITTISRKSVTIGNQSFPVSDNYRDRLFSLIS